MLKAFLIDDEIIALKSLQLLIENFENISIEGVYQNPLKAMRDAAIKAPDVIFIDIEMPEISGIYVAEQFMFTLAKKPAIVFVTAYNEYAVKAFELNAVDYILKPVSPKRFKETIDRIQEKIVLKSDKTFTNSIEANTKKIFVYEDKDIILIRLDEILYFESLEDGVYAVTKCSSYKTKRTLEYFQMRISKEMFFRCHRGYLVNVNKIMRLINMISTYNIVLEGVKYPIPLSKNRAKELKKLLEY